MNFVKQPNLAGVFYPSEKSALLQTIRYLLYNAEIFKINDNLILPKAMIVPHAGYIYSGKVAAIAYKPFYEAIPKPKNIVLIGPSHFVSFYGLVTTKIESFTTPLGQTIVNQKIITELLNNNLVQILESAFENEHCLEIQLPFIHEVLSDSNIIPILVGNADYAEVSKVLQFLWGGSDTLIIVSSDLSHYYTYEIANKIDLQTSLDIENMNISHIQPDVACGSVVIQGLLNCAKDLGLKAVKLELKNSGDTAGDKFRVVGYGSYYIY